MKEKIPVNDEIIEITDDLQFNKPQFKVHRERYDESHQYNNKQPGCSQTLCFTARWYNF